MADFRKIQEIQKNEKIRHELEERQRIEDERKNNHAYKEKALEQAKEEKRLTRLVSSLDGMVRSVLSDFGKAAFGSNPIWPWSDRVYTVSPSNVNYGYYGYWYCKDLHVRLETSPNTHFVVTTDLGTGNVWRLEIHATCNRQSLVQAINELYVFAKENKSNITSNPNNQTYGKINVTFSHYVPYEPPDYYSTHE
jgi:hypothetical protein